VDESSANFRSPAKVIVADADNIRANLIMMPTQGDGAFPRVSFRGREEPGGGITEGSRRIIPADARTWFRR